MKDKQEEKEKLYETVYHLQLTYVSYGNIRVLGIRVLLLHLDFRQLLGLALHDIFAPSSNDLHFTCTCTCSTSCLIRLDPFNSEAT